MKMSEVKVGMRFKTMGDGMGPFDNRILRVTEITARGFKYDFEDGQYKSMNAFETMSPFGLEHFGIEGNVWGLEQLPQSED